MQKGLDISPLGENRTIYLQQGREKITDRSPLSLDLTYLFQAPNDPAGITLTDFEALAPIVLENHRKLKAGEGDCLDKGVPMLGWLTLPEELKKGHLQELNLAADEMASRIDAFVSLGIGGSYLGIEASWKALTHTYYNQLSREERGGRPEIYFMGNNLDPDYYRDTFDLLKGKRIGINVISKSGTTAETAIAFRIILKLMEDSLGPQSRDLIIATTDEKRGALRKLGSERGYKTLIIPDNVGGRYSVLTDVGLFGLAVAGIDIFEFAEGFKDMKLWTDSEDFWNNPALLHCCARYLACMKGKKVEVVATNSAALYHICRWMEQLFPESEGHRGKGLWVSPSLYSEKLHANGQMVQEGERNILETFLLLREHHNKVAIPLAENDGDELNYLPEGGKDLNFLNRVMMAGTAFAHYNGGVPNLTIEIAERSPYHLGALYFMLERSVAISGYLLGHNPFVQPGVEAYKRAIFALAGKPGKEREAEEISAAISKLKRIILEI